MKESNAIEVPATVQPQSQSQPDNCMAVAPREQRLSLAQVRDALVEMKKVMNDCMVEQQDYGKVPGCGDKPSLFQPGAQKLSLMFNLSVNLFAEVVTDYQNNHRGYRTTVRVSSPSKHADGVGECSTLESKYRYRQASKTCPCCGVASVFKDKRDAGAWYCWTKKGGCGVNFVAGSPNALAIEAQDTAQAENENPADQWNTARKMAFKRGFVHAIINFTNTSELWSQDLEDLAANGVVVAPATAAPATATPRQEPPPLEAKPIKPKPAQTVQGRTSKPASNAQPPQAGGWRSVVIHFGKNSGAALGSLSEKSLRWYCEHFTVQSSYTGKDGKTYTSNRENMEKQTALRAALDEAAQEFQWSDTDDDVAF